MWKLTFAVPASVVPLCLAEGLVAFCALAFEVIAARMLAPYAGMSTDTWTSIIGAFLIAMALGNRIGGSLAGAGGVRHRLWYATLATIAGGIAVATTPLVIAAWDAWVLAPSPTVVWRVALFCAVPCIPAGILFGIAAPLLMMSVLNMADGQGRTIGAMYAAGAVGSVAGVLSALWVLLDGFGVRASLAMVGAVSLANAVLIAAVALRQGRPDAIAA